MTSDPKEAWKYEEGRNDLQVEFPDQHKLIPGLAEEDWLGEFLKVVQVGPRHWRILESPVMSEAVTWGDLVEADIEEGRCLVIKRLVGTSEFRTIRTGVPHLFYFSDFGKAFLDRVMELGGMWEIIFWGILILNLPEGHAEELEELFHAACVESSEQSKTNAIPPRILHRLQPGGGSVRREEEN